MKKAIILTSLMFTMAFAALASENGVFMEFHRYPEKANDVEFISNKYVELISASLELTEEDKDLLYSAISVAVSSFEYWENEL